MGMARKRGAMKSWTDIAELLLEPIPEGLIEEPDRSKGIYGQWMKGSVAMTQANFAFGPDAWSTEITVPPVIENVEIELGPDGTPRKGIIVTTVVRVTALGYDKNGEVLASSREDIGWGTAAASWDGQRGRYLPLKPQQIRAAVMGSVTLAIKRCLHQYGRFLGMQLYITDEDTIAMLWAKGADGVRPSEEPGPERRKPKPEQRAQPTDQQIAEQLGIEITDENRDSVVQIGVKTKKLAQLGSVAVATKVARVQVGEGATVEQVFRQLPGHAAWMVAQALDGSKTAAFVAMADYELFHREMTRLAYKVGGGDYEPWEGAGVRDPTMMLGVRLERKVLASDDFKEALIARFADDSGEAVNEFHFRGHLKAHFQVERLALITWEQLAALRAHVLTDAEYPEQWRKHDAPAAEEAPSPGPAEAEAVKEEPVDFEAECGKLLAEVDEKLQLSDQDSLAVKFTAEYTLDSQAALNAVVGIHKAVMAENLKGEESTAMMLETTLKALT